MKYVLIGKKVCFVLLFQVIVLCTHAQCPSVGMFYQQLLKLENNNSMKDAAKLKEILILKKQFEDCKLSEDSVYARILHRAGRLEYETNNHKLTSSIINNTLEAARINTSGRKVASEPFGVKSYYNLAIYYFNIPYYTKALLYFDSAIYFNRNYSEQQSFTNDALSFKALSYSYERDYEKCAEISTLGIAVTTKSKDSFNLTRFFYLRAQGYCNQGIWKQAKPDIDTGLYLANAIKSNQLLTDFLNLKALYCASEKDYSNAEVCFQMELQLRLSEENNYDLTNDYLAYGNYYLNDHKNADAAIACYKKIIPLCHSPEDNVSFSKAYTAIAEANFRKGDLKMARHNDSLAASFLLQASPKNFLENAPAVQLSAIEYKDELLVFMNNKIELLLSLYKQNHQPEYIKACLQTALVMDTLVTKTRHEQLGEQSKLYWRNKTREYFNNAIEACYLSGNDSLAFHFMEKSRAVLLYDKLNELEAAVHLSSEESRKEESYQIKLMELQQQLSQQMPGSTEFKTEQAQLFQMKDELEQYIRSLEKNNPVYYQYKYDDNIPSLTDLKNYTDNNNQSFVYYYKNDSIIYALSISKNKTNFIKISASDFDTHRLSEFINLCSNKQATNNNYGKFASLSQSIYNSLFKPLQLPKGNVAICTDNFFIPFEALCTDDKGKNFLLYDYNFSYVYSARSLMKPFTGNKATVNFAGFAPVSFSSRLGVLPLRNSATALTNVAGYYSNSTLFTKQQATRNNFFNQASKYAVVTIFSHAQADTTDKEPVLYMQDSLIHLSELSLLRNPAIQFVLLSACQTNIGRNATGEGIYSLARGFAAAGVPSVSATLWKANEEAVYQISAKFNEYLSQGMNKSDALQKAKVWYLQNSNREHTLPYYWANMVLIGTSQPIALTAANPLWYWVAGIIGFAIIISVAFYFIYTKRVRLKK